MLEKPRRLALPLALLTLLAAVPSDAESRSDRKFEKLAARYLDEFPAFSPVSATFLGDHRFDGELDELSPTERARGLAFDRKILAELERIDREALSPANRVDAALLDNSLRYALWATEELREWAWNPTWYTGLTGGAVYGLVARDFAPLAERLGHVADRLEKLPRLYEQIRATLEPELVPKVHAETAVAQNRGLLSILDQEVAPHLAALPGAERARLETAIATARAATDEHQRWLEEELLPRAGGDFRIGAERYEKKLAFDLVSSIPRAEIRERAWAEYASVRDEMYEVAKGIYAERYPMTEFSAAPSAGEKQAITRAALEVVYRDRPARGEIEATARRFLEQTTAFVREHDLVTVPDDPVEVVVMPEFRRGVSLAYCDSPGALDAGQTTFYAVSPLPDDWTPEQDESFLREYNDMGVQVLTIHEAMPGHYLQLAHANRYPSKLRAVLSSGSFIEGWAVYGERVMLEAGYLDGDPRFHLIVLKLRLRAVINAILDQEIHAGTMSRDEAMRLMIEGGFQEEGEAAGKWVRAQLTSAQLSTYFVGYLEHLDLRRDAEARLGDAFDLKSYHDRVLSFGSPPVRFVRQLMGE